MNTNDVQTEPPPVQPGSYSADALASSMEEKFAALFRQVHPPVLTAQANPGPVGVEEEARAAEMN